MKIKRIAALLLAGIMSVGLCSCASSNTSSASESSSAAESNADGSAADSTDSTASEGGDWQYIADKGNFVAGITLFEPMNYYDENGELTGFETEFTKAVCEKLGVEAKFQEIEWDKKEIELNAKTIDAIWNGLTVTEERKENMGFSKSYVRNKQVVVIKADNKDKYTDEASMAGASCAAESGSAGQTAIETSSVLSQNEFVGASAQKDVLLEVKAGTVELGVLDYVMAKASIGEGTDYSDLMIVEGVELAPEEYAIGMRKGDTETIEKINGAIDELVADGTLKALAEKYGLADVYAFDN
ncbi:aBC-type amino acid transport/signal transduction systems periplasmic component/domain [Eubacterium sp. CAG:115]|nr:aBC-type amino acid transport/signal transduction systems periplasmic component/domain [Eubacterium sp. CAG:115]